MKLFCGLEAEGRHRGKRTLFVEGPVHSQHIITHGIVEGMMTVEGKLLDYEQVYFGARFLGQPDKQVSHFKIVPMCEQDILEAAAAIIESAESYPVVTVVTIELNAHRGRVSVPTEYLQQHPRVELMVPLALIDHDWHVLGQLSELMADGFKNRIQFRLDTLQGCMIFPGEEVLFNAKIDYNKDQVICSNK